MQQQAAGRLEIQIEEQNLPVLSVVATEALKLLGDENVTNVQIERLVNRDPALTQRILMIANSPFYCGQQPALTAAAAAMRLGMRQLRRVILTAATGELFDNTDARVATMWTHLLATAMAAHCLAESIAPSLAEEAYTAGLLHDVGKLLVYQQHSEVYGALLDEAAATGRPLIELEEERLTYFTHATVGGLAVRHWQLGADLSEAARGHHVVEREVPQWIGNRPLVCLVALANKMVNRRLLGRPELSDGELAAQPYGAALHLTPERLAGLSGRIDLLLEQNVVESGQA